MKEKRHRSLVRPTGTYREVRDLAGENMPTRVIGSKLDPTGSPVHTTGQFSSREAMPPKNSAGAISAEQVRKGLPMKALDDLARILNVDRAALADILGTSVRTLQRKAEENDRLGPVASDRLARVRRILDLATHVLGETDKASRWLTSESRALDGEVPLHMLDTDIGTQRVQQELRQIEFGMPL
jgi:putative toxin-antitoxin system antitoxin component (TIGR02293 family)